MLCFLERKSNKNKKNLKKLELNKNKKDLIFKYKEWIKTKLNAFHMNVNWIKKTITREQNRN